jgi:hypothetical protein
MSLLRIISEYLTTQRIQLNILRVRPKVGQQLLLKTQSNIIS